MPMQGGGADRERLGVIAGYADRLLAEAGDSYNEPASPLLADGIRLSDRTLLEWHFADGTSAVISNLALQQNLMRFFHGLSKLSGNSKYIQSAQNNFSFYFKNYQSPCGLLDWGGHRFVDLSTLEVRDTLQYAVHELKNNLPYYDLMFDVNPEASSRYVRAMWNAHVYDWRTLEMGRHGKYGKPMGGLWDSVFEEQPPFFEAEGLPFLVTGDDLMYGAAKLYERTAERGALVWALLLAERYVKARDPKTGLGAYLFTRPKKTGEAPDDKATLSQYGDRAARQFGPEFGPAALEATLLLQRQATMIYSKNALVQMEICRMLGEKSGRLSEYTRSGMAAFVQHAYDPDTNLCKPMLANGTDLCGFKLARDGYFGCAGTVLEPCHADEEFLLSYSRAYTFFKDPLLWRMVYGIARSCGLGDWGNVPGQHATVNLLTANDSPHALFAVLDIYKFTGFPDFLNLGRAIGANIISNRFQCGYFVPKEGYCVARIDALEPYALLALEASVRGIPEQAPVFLNGSGYLDGEYRLADGSVRMLHDDALFSENTLGIKYQPSTHRQETRP